MEATKFVVSGIIGLIVGGVIGYLPSAHENAKLTNELAKTRAWLLDEIRQSSAPRNSSDGALEQADSARAKLAEDLEKVRGDLRHTKAVLRECVTDWRSEQQRRRTLEDRLALRERGRPSPGVAGGVPPLPADDVTLPESSAPAASGQTPAPPHRTRSAGP